VDNCLVDQILLFPHRGFDKLNRRARRPSDVRGRGFDKLNRRRRGSTDDLVVEQRPKGANDETTDP